MQDSPAHASPDDANARVHPVVLETAWAASGAKRTQPKNAQVASIYLTVHYTGRPEVCQSWRGKCDLHSGAFPTVVGPLVALLLGGSGRHCAASIPCVHLTGKDAPCYHKSARCAPAGAPFYVP